MIEYVLAVALLQDAFIVDCFRDEEAEIGLLEDGSALLRLRVARLLVVSEDNNARFCSMRLAVFVWFHDQYAH